MEDFIYKWVWIIVGICALWVVVRFLIILALTIIEETIVVFVPWYKDEIELFFIRLGNFICTLRWKTNLED